MMSLPESYDDVPLAWVGDWVGRRAQLTPKREALYDTGGDERFTYEELNERANRLAAYLMDDVGLGPGDVVSFVARNRVELIDLYFACGKTGLILAPLSHRLAKPELDDLLHRLQPKAFVHETALAETVDALSIPDSVEAAIALSDDGASDFDERVASAELRETNRPLAMNAPFLYVHTGGTTATPKICIVTHRQMIWNSFDLIATIWNTFNLIATGSSGASMEGKELVTFPFFHVGGWNTVTPIFHMGGSAVLMREFEADLALELIERERIIHFGGVEAMFRFMMNSERFDDADLSSVGYINSAGAPCAEDVMEAFWAKGVPMTQSYGLTEAGPSNFIFVPDEASFDETDIKAHADSIGFPMYHCDAEIVDPDSREPVPQGEVGEIRFRSPHNFEGYLDDPERTAEAIDADGWVYSGDLAKRDDEGFVRIVGRADNVFFSGGENISPEEIENALSKHPAVAQVGVAGVPDAEWGQVGLAAVVLESGPSADEAELKAFCREHLAGFKVPKHVRFVDELPLTGAGKIDRKRIAQMLDDDNPE